MVARLSVGDLRPKTMDARLRRHLRQKKDDWLNRRPSCRRNCHGCCPRRLSLNSRPSVRRRNCVALEAASSCAPLVVPAK